MELIYSLHRSFSFLYFLWLCFFWLHWVGSGVLIFKCPLVTINEIGVIKCEFNVSNFDLYSVHLTLARFNSISRCININTYHDERSGNG